MSPAGKLPQTVAKRSAPPRDRGDAETYLSGRDNRWLKKVRAALRSGDSAAGSLVGVEGARLVEEALRSGLRVEAVLVSTSGERHLDRLARWIAPGVRVLRTTDRLFAGVADTQTPQGVAALVHPRAVAFDDIVCGAAGSPLVVVLVGVQDPGNVGTILRAAEAFGATGAAACASPTSGTANPLAPKALRASAGSALRLPVIRGVAVSILLAQLRIARVKLYAACPEPPPGGRGRGTVRDTETSLPLGASAGQPILNPWEADLRGPAALLVGNEGAGLPPEVERSADALVRIPLAAGVSSLNAAVAASVLLYEAARQRRSLQRRV
jgi:TrmH family RNA methyltransferase